MEKNRRDETPEQKEKELLELEESIALKKSELKVIEEIVSVAYEKAKKDNPTIEVEEWMVRTRMEKLEMFIEENNKEPECPDCNNKNMMQMYNIEEGGVYVGVVDGELIARNEDDYHVDSERWFCTKCDGEIPTIHSNKTRFDWDE